MQQEGPAPAAGMQPLRRATMQENSHAAGLGVQQSSTALALRSSSLALVASNAAEDVALLDEEEVPRAEHQLRQKVVHAALLHHDRMVGCEVMRCGVM